MSRRMLPAALLLALASCARQPPVERSFHPDGRPEAESAWVIDEHGERVRDGAFRAWHEDGTLRAQGSFVRGLQHGTWRQWHPDGTLGSEEEWELGVRTGSWRIHHANGRLLAAGTYRAGKESGPWHYWHPDGKLRARGSYLHGAREGVWIERDEQGELDAHASGLYGAGQKIAELARPAEIAAVEAAWREREDAQGGNEP